MAQIEKKQGHAAEHSEQLHTLLKTVFCYDHIVVNGKSNTKTDYYGVTNYDSLDPLNPEPISKISRFSNKFAKGKSTQVWLPTQASIFDHLPELLPCKSILVSWLGSIDNQGLSVPRKSYTDISNFSELELTLNTITRNKVLLKHMLLAKGDEEPVQYITWIGKKQGIQIIDANLYVEYIVANASWVTTKNKRGESIKLIDKNTGEILFHLQRAGNGPDKQKISPLFHIHKSWPKSVIVYSDDTFKLSV